MSLIASENLVAFYGDPVTLIGMRASTGAPVAMSFSSGGFTLNLFLTAEMARKIAHAFTITADAADAAKARQSQGDEE